MNWFSRKDKNISTPTSQKKELPDGMWYKTPGGSIVHIRELKNNSYVCSEDDYHVRIGSKEYFDEVERKINKPEEISGTTYNI